MLRCSEYEGTALRADDSRVTPVTFVNRKGLRLFGILHSPGSGPPPGLGLILLSPGVKMRVGPQRLYLRVAELFVSMGIPVLRFDFFGLGDSEGALDEELLRDVYNHIEVGRFIDDTVDAMDWMQQKTGISRFILSGLCGGAITGLLAGERDARVAGLFALAITPVLASRSADPSLYITSGQAAEISRTYLSKLASPRAWFRLLSFRSDYRLIWRSLTRSFRPRPSAPENATPAVDDNASPLFPPAFFRMIETGRPMLLVFGASDRLGAEFDEKFVARHRSRLTASADGYTVHRIPYANHVLSFAEWQQEMIDVTKRWLQTHFARDICATIDLRQAAAPAATPAVAAEG